ncbi:MAG: intracellular growth attenuator family protein, partial [Enterobacterales bacterium]|nr:intracellular growth attenuator family protein [Enterobacterales bacterium]
SDEGKQLVNHPQPAISLYDYTAIDQWRELESLSQQLLMTPFKASGVITELSTDANGTRHIMLHSEPDGLTLWRYILTCALLLAVTLIIIVNALMFMFRIQKSMNRIPEIQRYYDQCINHSIMPFDTAPRR